MPKYHLDSIFDPAHAHPDDAHSILMRLIPGGSRVLELGCATGYLSGYMEQELGCRVTGLEYDPEAVAIARTRCQEVYQVDLDVDGVLQVAQTSAPYDVLLAAAVLEHLKHPERLLQEACAVLKPGARIVVSLPNVAHWGVRWRLLQGKFDYTDYGIMDRTHLHFYTVQTGRALLEDQGYTIDQLLVAGSGVQNLLSGLVHRMKRPPLRPILPGLFGYELIYVAHK